MVGPFHRLQRKVQKFFIGEPEHPVLAANEKHFQAVSQDSPLDRCSFTVIDTELTGLNHRMDEIVSIGAVRIENMAIDVGNCFYALVHPKVMTKTSILIHGITPDEVEDAPRMYKVMPRLIDFVGDSFIVGHHIGLDMNFLNLACTKIFNAPFPNPCIDTMRLAQAYKEQMWKHFYERFNLHISYNLSLLAKEWDLPRFEAHNALTDALQTAYLFLFLVKKLNRGEIHSLKDLYDAGKKPARFV